MPFKEQWAWRNPATRQVLPERYNSQAEALEYIPRANVWELVRVTPSYKIKEEEPWKSPRTTQGRRSITRSSTGR